MCSRILALIEVDERANQVIESLKLPGHEVISCSNYKEAIRLIQKTRFAMIISDVHLENGGNVFDFLRWVKRNASTIDTPFVLYSCKPTSTAKYLEDSIRCSARLLGASKYIVMESFDTDEFRRQIALLCPPVLVATSAYPKKRSLRELHKYRTRTSACDPHQHVTL